jgi:DNA (cytosine-5)-methyltransferase 1
MALSAGSESMTFFYYDFFAGGGMVQAGLGPNWICSFANDIDPKKALSYATNWGEQQFVVRDVAELTTANLPGVADLAWASFPCQDLSQAGKRAGLQGRRSAAFWPFWNLMKALCAEKRAPRMIVLENVKRALTSHKGKDFAAVCSALASEGYRVGAMVVDAAYFLPQSRPRLFIVAVNKSLSVPTGIAAERPADSWYSRKVVEAYKKFSRELQDAWIWWLLPSPAKRNSTFGDVLEADPLEVGWDTEAETKRLLGMMSEVNLKKVAAGKRAGKRMIGGLYKRMRKDSAGLKVQRAEIRFDGVAGCLRTPAGGSSRQTVMIVEGESIRSRLLSPRELARLMGLPEEYAVPSNYNEAYHLAGDGVAVPVVRFLAAHILEPILAPSASDRVAAE